MNYKTLQENAHEAAEFLKTLGNEWRLMVLCSLGTTEKSVSTLEGELGIKAGQTTPDGRFSLATARCVGSCGQAPVLVVGPLGR